MTVNDENETIKVAAFQEKKMPVYQVSERDFMSWGASFGVLKSMFQLIKFGAKQSGLEVEAFNVERAIRHFENSDLHPVAVDDLGPSSVEIPEVKQALLDLSTIVMQLYIQMSGSFKLVRSHGGPLC